MEFIKIDMENWTRKDSYNNYLNNIPCTYSMTVNLDITKLLQETQRTGIKFFPSILYCISYMVNSHKEFRMDFDSDKNLGYYSYSNPSYSVFHSDSETITNIWTSYTSDFNEFVKSYHKDLSEYGGNYKITKALPQPNIFSVSMIPWASFTGFNLNLQKGYDYLLPIFTLGKYFNSHGKTLIPLAIQVHHSVCDGFHLSRFVNQLQEFIDEFQL